MQKAYEQLLNILSLYNKKPTYEEKLYLQDILKDYQDIIDKSPFFKGIPIAFKEVIETIEDGSLVVIAVFENPADRFKVLMDDGRLLSVREMAAEQGKVIKKFALKIYLQDLTKTQIVLYEDKNQFLI